MIVYRDRREQVSAPAALARVRGLVEALGTRPSHDAATGVLIALGMLECGVADALHPEHDEEDALGRAFRDAMLGAGHLLRATWSGRTEETVARAQRLGPLIRRIEPAILPDIVSIELPEGFALYGLYPECYLAAAERCAEQLACPRYVCVGLRGIGAALAAVVGAALEARGHEVRTHTVRPRGRPYDRQVRLGPRLAALLRAREDTAVLVVDEGPGISGSSFAGTASALNRLGYPDHRIALLPSWRTDGRLLRSPEARRRWSLHPKYTAEFEEVWIPSGRLEAALGEAHLEDISAGKWRDALLPAHAPRPPVHPQHERRKYLGDGTIATFAGLGGIAERRRARAGELAWAGYTPSPREVAHGFLKRDLVEGTPLRPGQADGELLDTMGAYLSYLARHFRTAGGGGHELTAMVTANVTEALGAPGIRQLERHRRAFGTAAVEHPIAVDGRMLPHEWLRTARGYLKVDALDHHDDHFFPGHSDIAWDLAGAAVEFMLEPAAGSRLVDRYRRESGDRTIAARLPAFAVAYLAFRLGYATLAAETLGETADGRAFAGLRDRYTGALRAELASTVSRWSA